MRKEEYIALENEITSFNKNKERVTKNKLKELFSSLKQQPHYIHKKEITFTQQEQEKKEVIRTETGNAYYIDGSVIEIATPPIEINHGFATRLTNAIITGRNTIIETIPLIHTGYSMHWNITSPSPKNSSEREKFMDNFVIPFQMFGLMPTSIGSAIRERYPRWEIMGDSIYSENQINATALLLGAYLQAFKKNTSKKQLKLEKRNSEKDNRIIYPNQYSNRTTTLGGKTTQQILVSFYEEIYEEIQKLGTHKEIQNLEGLIFQEKNLEIDNPDFWEKTKGTLINKHGIHYPTIHGEKTNILEKSTTREVPPEGKFYGIPILQNATIQKFDWENLIIEKDKQTKKISGIRNILEYGKSTLETHF